MSVSADAEVATAPPVVIEDDLVDGYRLMLEPILLGGGKRVSKTTGEPAHCSWCQPRRDRLWVPRTVSWPLISAFAASQPRSHGSQAAQQDRSP
jgi:hypothetical protein